MNQGGKPFVLFNDPEQGEKGTVMAFENGTWSLVGNPGFTAKPIVQQGDIEIGPDGNPWVIGLGQNPSSTGAVNCPCDLEVWKFNGTTWVAAGPSISILATINPKIEFYNGIPYIAFHERFPSGNWGIQVMKLVGQNWQTLGNAYSYAPPNGNSVQYMSLAVYNDIPYVGYTLDRGGVSVRKLDGATWVDVDNPGLTATQNRRIGRIELTFNSSGNLFLGFSTEESTSKISVYKIWRNQLVTSGNFKFCKWCFGKFDPC